jgi:hypothetical protein
VVTSKVFGEILQLLFAEFAILVRVEFHRVFDHAIGIRSGRWATGSARPPFRSAALTSSTGATGGRSTLSAATWTGTVWAATIWTAPFRATTYSASTTSLLTAASGTACTRPPRACAASAVRTAAGSARSTTHRSDFVFGQLAVFVLVQRLQRSRRILEFIGRDHTIVIGIESFEDRRASAAGSATLPAARASTRSAATGTAGWLSNGCRDTRDNQKSERPRQSFHENISNRVEDRAYLMQNSHNARTIAKGNHLEVLATQYRKRFDLRISWL